MATCAKDNNSSTTVHVYLIESENADSNSILFSSCLVLVRTTDDFFL